MFTTNQSILDAQKEYIEAGKKVTAICLEVEKTCPHSVWCGKDWRSSEYGGSSFPAIYICMNCRMEVHIPHADYVSYEKPPEGSIVLRPNLCGVDDVLNLRIRGDNRGHLKKDYSTIGGWPVRKDIPEEETA